jgi:hypothetical protein
LTTFLPFLFTLFQFNLRDHQEFIPLVAGFMEFDESRRLSFERIRFSASSTFPIINLHAVAPIPNFEVILQNREIVYRDPRLAHERLPSNVRCTDLSAELRKRIKDWHKSLKLTPRTGVLHFVSPQTDCFQITVLCWLCKQPTINRVFPKIEIKNYAAHVKTCRNRNNRALFGPQR